MVENIFIVLLISAVVVIWWNVPTIFEIIKGGFNTLFNLLPIPKMTDYVYEEIQKDKERRKLMFIKKEEYDRLQERIAELEAEVSEERRQCSRVWTKFSTDYLKDYRYAILMPLDGHIPRIWNDGRFEEHVREVEFSSSYEYFPELRIRK